MLYKIVTKSGLFIISALVLSCAATDNINSSDNEQQKSTAPATDNNETKQTNVVPSLDEAKKKSTPTGKAKTDKKKLPAKASKEARIAQVKDIMKSKNEIEKQYEKKQRGKNPNAFYRFKREKAITRALIDDGVHDPTADLSDLQQPIEALRQFPKSKFGNGVNWVSALNKHEINPRADQLGKQEQFTLDMNIPMKVSGTMNDVLFPHKAHTAWLACSNCHTEIFQMKRGGNPITMKKIIDGQYCGVCHGKVAFPIANCNRCHSVSKQATNTKKTVK